MKKLTVLTSFMAIGISCLAYADVPMTINYQGRITQGGSPVSDIGTHQVQLSIYNSPGAISWLWRDTYNVSTKNGYFDIEVGGGNSLNAMQSFWFNQPCWLGVKIDTDSEMIPRHKLESVPYALNIADNIVLTSKIADSAVTGSKIADNAVTTSKIANGAITTAKLAGQAVTAVTIADNTIIGAKIAPGTILQDRAPFAPKVAVNGTWRNNPIIASGVATSDVNGDLHIDFSAFGFSIAPVVVCNANRDPATKMNIEHYNVTNTGFAVKTWDFTGVTQATIFDWMAIGY